jgi:hypothetical protein
MIYSVYTTDRMDASRIEKGVIISKIASLLFFPSNCSETTYYCMNEAYRESTSSGFTISWNANGDFKDIAGSVRYDEQRDIEYKISNCSDKDFVHLSEWYRVYKSLV